MRGKPDELARSNPNPSALSKVSKASIVKSSSRERPEQLSN